MKMMNGRLPMKKDGLINILANDIAVMKEGFGKGYLVIIERVVEKAERKAAL